MKSLITVIVIIGCLALIVAGIGAVRLKSFLHTHPIHHERTLATQPPITPVSLPRNATLSDASTIDHPISSGGCGTRVSIPKGKTSLVTLSSGHRQRSYLVYLPANYANTRLSSLVLNFHGYAANGYQQEQISHFDALANTSHFITVYPNGTEDRSGESGWNTGLHPAITSKDVLFVSNLLNQMQQNFCIDPQRIYATGFSNGGGFVNLLACKMSNRIAAFAPVSGSYVTPFKICTITRPVPIIEFHGTADKTVPYNGNLVTKELSVLNWIDDWTQRDACLKKPVVLFKTPKVIAYTWPDCKSQAAVIHYKIIGEPHQWPTLLFPQQSNGKTKYVNTATVIWNFFRQHNLPTT